MKKLNLFTLLIFLGTNFLTPLSYAQVENLEDMPKISREVSLQADSQEDVSGDVDLENSDNESFADAQNGESDVQDSNEVDQEGVENLESFISQNDIRSSEFQVLESESELLDKPSEDLEMLVEAGMNGIIKNPDANITYTDTNGKVFTGIGTITITSGEQSITILDRNLGATVAGTGEESYGYHFQRGNNYGFSRVEDGSAVFAGDEVAVDGATDGFADTSANAWNNPYVSSTFITDNGWNNEAGWSNPYNQDLWGGKNDLSNGWGDTSADYKRQGPCPAGYHVPSQKEIDDLLVMYYSLNKNGTMNGGDYEHSVMTNTTFSRNFRNAFNVPFAGRRSYDTAEIGYMGSWGYFWVSSAYADGFPESRHSYVSIDRVANIQYAGRGVGLSLRCFLDNPLANPSDGPLILEYETDGGSAIQSQTIPVGEKAYLPGYTTHKDGYTLIGWFNEDGTVQYALSGNQFEDLTLTQAMADSDGVVKVYAKWEESKDIVLEVIATEAGDTIMINKYFANDYTVDWGDGNTGDLTADTGHSYDVASGYTITLSLSGTNRWTFQNVYKSLVPQSGTTVTGVKITYMPSLADGFGNSATNPGNNFFYAFNYYGALTNLPVNSFDTSSITTVGYNFFRTFNYHGALTSLPVGSFNISNITTVGKNFFGNFNRHGELTSLPEGSFDTSNINTISDNFFWQFNTYGLLESLPENSFNISNISGSVGNDFFFEFNCVGKLTDLPEGSFDTSHITSVGNRFFDQFNYNGELTNLSTGSFDTSNIITVGDDFFSFFNYGGKLTSLPTGSFRLSTGLTEVGNSFFYNFNGFGQLTSLPSGSFDTSNITTAGYDFFRQINPSGKLTNLPDNSFNISNLTTVGDNAFRYFNGMGGALESLPEGSFDASNIISAGTGFSSYFNYEGNIITLPNSFTLSSIGASRDYGYQNAFNSTGYTLNKKVSDLVAGVTEPSEDMDTFSDNQPGRCGVHPNWLVNPETACNVLYDANGGEGTITGGYDTYTTGVAAGSGIVKPTRTGYILSGWLDASGNNVEEVIFPEMDGKTLYAQWSPILYTITYNLDGGENNGNNPATYTVESGNILLAQPNKTGYMFLGWTGSNGDEPNTSVKIPAGSTGNRTYNAVWGIFEDLDIYFVSDTGNVVQYTFMDRNLGATTNDIDDEDSYGYYYKWGNNEGFLGYIDDWDAVPTGTWTEGEQGPCPNGYHIPQKDEFVGLGFGWTEAMGVATPASEIDVLFQDNDLFDLIKQDFMVSLAGGKASAGGILYGPELYVGWHSSEEYDSGNDYILWFSQQTSEHFFKVGRTNKNSGYPVRCFKDSNEKAIQSVQLDGGTGVIIAVKGGHITRLSEPRKSDYDFDGWYSDSGFSTQVSVGDVPPSILYAKWKPIEYTITYQLNDGAISGENINPEKYTIESGNITLINPVKTGYVFLGWSGTDIDGMTGTVMIPSGSTGDRVYEANWHTDQYTITFDTDKGTAVASIVGDFGSPIQVPANPTRNGYRFIGWDPEIPATIPAENLTIKAIWEKLGSSGGGPRGGDKPDASKDDNTHSSAESPNDIDSQPSQPTGQSIDKDSEGRDNFQEYSPDFQEYIDAYEFAYEKGITTKPTVESAIMSGNLTRIAMAKMLSQYAINVLGRSLDKTRVNKFNDVSEELDSKYNNGVTLAYQLGIMGQNMKGNNFRPNDEVTRAEFATALSRMLYNTSDGEYKGTNEYYTNHIKVLKEKGIMTKGTPRMKEKRGYVMIMLMRSAK